MTSSEAEAREQILTEAMAVHSQKLLGVIRKIVRDQVEAEDILQDVFEEYIESYDLGQAIDALGAWLVQVAKNKTVDRFRRKKTQRSHEDLTKVEDLDNSPSPEDEALRAQMREEILSALQLLPKEQQDIFIQHELEGKSFEEISRETGVSLNTLLSRKRYAVLFLRNHLKEIYDELNE